MTPHLYVASFPPPSPPPSIGAGGAGCRRRRRVVGARAREAMLAGGSDSRAKQAEYNLGVLKRRDASIQSIVGSAGHVVLYQFNEENKAWDRKNVEGSLFVVERATAPRHQFVVLNRLSSENLVETVDENFQTELTEQFLLYRNSSSEILGVWFYSPPERAAIADLLTSLTSAAPQPSAQADGGVSPAANSDAPRDEAPSKEGSQNNVAQFFNMMAETQQAPPPMPERAVTAAAPAEPPASIAAPGPRPAVDMSSLKVKLASQLRALVDDDAFLSLLANEYLRQQQRAMQQACKARLNSVERLPLLPSMMLISRSKCFQIPLPAGAAGEAAEGQPRHRSRSNVFQRALIAP